MSRQRLIKGSLLKSETADIVKDIMNSPHDEKFVSTLLYQRVSLNMYLDAYRFNHGITNDDNLPDYLQELIKIYKLIDMCVKYLPHELKTVYDYLFVSNLTMDEATHRVNYAKTSIHRYKNLILKTLANCLNV